MAQQGKTVVAVTVAAAIIAIALIAYWYYYPSGPRPQGPTAPSTTAPPQTSTPIPWIPVREEPTINVTVEGVRPGKPLPPPYTCDYGKPETPRIEWSPLRGAKSYAVIVLDPDAPMGVFYHLVVYNIPANQNTWPPGGTIGVNSAGQKAWFPACPPHGHGRHRYYFIVLGLDLPPSLEPGLDGPGLLEAVEGHVIGYGYVYGVYER